MNARTAALAALLASAVAVPAATAAAPACRLVSDPRGDGRNTGYTSTPADGVYASSDLDLLSADVATNKSSFTAVVRTATLHEQDSESPTGRMYEVSFVAGEQRYVVSVMITPDGMTSYVYKLEGSDYGDQEAGARPGGPAIGKPTVVLDYKRAEVRMTAPLKMFAPYTPLSNGRVLRGIEAWTYHYYGSASHRVELPANYVIVAGTPGTGESVDSGLTKRTYTVGARSCVTVGR